MTEQTETGRMVQVDHAKLCEIGNEIRYVLSHIETALEAIDLLHGKLGDPVAENLLEGLLSIIVDRRFAADQQAAKIFGLFEPVGSGIQGRGAAT